MQIGQLTEIEVLPVQRVGGRGEGIHIYPVQRHTAAAAARRHHLHHRRCAGVQHRVAAGLDDPGFGGGDLLHCVAQIGRVIQPNVAQHSRLRRGDDVGGVEFAAHAHLAHHDIAPPPGEPCERDGRHDLELQGWSSMPSASGRTSSVMAHSSSSGMGCPSICIRSLNRKM